MKLISKMSAIELQRATDQAEYYAADSGPELMEALKEVKRLRIVCQDIIEVIGCEYAGLGKADEAISKIDDLAHEYFKV